MAHKKTLDTARRELNKMQIKCSNCIVFVFRVKILNCSTFHSSFVRSRCTPPPSAFYSGEKLSNFSQKGEMQQQSESRKLPITFNFLTTTFPLHRRRGIKSNEFVKIYIHFTVAHNLHIEMNFSMKNFVLQCVIVFRSGQSRKLAVFRFPLRYVHP